METIAAGKLEENLATLLDIYSIVVNLGSFTQDLRNFEGSLGIFLRFFLVKIPWGKSWVFGEKVKNCFPFLEVLVLSFGNLCRLERQILEIFLPWKVFFDDQHYIKMNFVDIDKFRLRRKPRAQSDKTF